MRGADPILLPYGKHNIELTVRFPSEPVVLDYRSEPEAPADTVIAEALRHPVSGPTLRQLAAGKSRAVILISDRSRLCPSHLFLPALLEELNAGGIPDDRIRIVVALGMHRKQTDAELVELTGEGVYRRVTVINHSAASEDCVHLGTTSLGTPIEINRIVVEADLRIATGNIEPHRLVGVSGGVKALVPGTASQRCIEANHSLSRSYKAKLGDPDNPIHRDMEEALQHVPIHFLFNVIASHRRELLEAYAGELTAAHRLGLQAARRRFLLPASRDHDIVIASTGGFPKDMQLYQAIKTLQNASAFVKPGGAIVLVARCEELYGNGIFQYWAEVYNRRSALQELKNRFVLGAHKLAHLDEVLTKHTVYLHSDMPDPLAELLGFRPAPDLNGTIRSLLREDCCRVAVLPHGALTFPEPG
ncbi:nickel-dependent lactate racemase [Paenibacillus flagellatus]|uniref:Nickel-dependent lactate racemase n=2 Tax=Paenibacillus flagellatus TaxID=2211139 RepID=A0A2V5KL08_9BACL|nr:nickel-dependent lactate racemase [Paenibacillus flagellatus]